MKNIPPFILVVLAVTASAQEKDSFYLLDAGWHPTPNRDSAKYFIRIKELADTSWQWDYYNMTGPLMRSEQFRDKGGQLQEGTSYYYDHTGRLDSTMQFRGGRKNGDARKYAIGDSLITKYKYVYKDDSLIEFVDVAKQNPEEGYTVVDEESEYPGGAQQWLRYLNKHLKYPDRAVNANIQGDVSVLFVVDLEGNVIKPVIARSVEYSLDDESLQIVQQSGKWSPAVMQGKNVRSYKLQPIVFRLQ